jgi:transposase
LYSSLISEWRKQRDADVLAGKRHGDRVGRLTAEQAEIARLQTRTCPREQGLSTTEAALDIMGKAHPLLESLSERADSDEQRKKR